jgi:parvulin-like peptidyl-prolyl isomerase
MEKARQDGLDQLPEVVEKMEHRREVLMVGRLHEKMIGEQVPEPTEAQLQEFYEAKPQAYWVPEQRACNIIVGTEEEAVREAHARMRGSADFMAVALQLQGGSGNLKSVETPPFSRGDQAFQEVEEEAFSLALSEISEPFETSNGWLLLQVREIIPERRLHLEDVYGQVEQNWKADWSERRLTDLVTEWKKDIPIHIDEDVLARTKVTRNDVFVPSE